MFIGHIAVGLGAKRVDPTPSLGSLLLATLLPDLLFPIFVLMGMERLHIAPGITAFTPLDLEFYPYSHSLLACALQAIIVGGIYYALRKKLKPAVLLAALVLIHFFLDALSHRPDLQLVWWSDLKIGLGLWNYIVPTLVIEISLYIIGTLFYLKATVPKNKTGTLSMISLLIFLSVAYLGSAFGPPPPGETEFAFTGLLTWLFVGWGYWIDRNRASVR